MGVNAPFGLKTDYDSDKWVGRYHADKSELLTININPSMAFKFNDNVSIGFGVSALYADGELTKCARRRTQSCQAWRRSGRVANDGKIKLTADDWGYGFNAGLLLTPTQNTRIGLHYRSEIDLNLEGDAKVTGSHRLNQQW